MLHWSFLKRFRTSVYLASVCRSLQCLVSALTLAGVGGLLLRFACSVVLRGGGRCRQISLACVGSTRSVPATLGLPPLRACVLSPSTLLGLPAALQGAAPSCVDFPGPSCSGSGFRVLHKSTDSVGPGFCAFPGPNSSGSQELERTLPQCSGLLPSAVPASVSARPPVWCTLCLFWGAGLWL